MRRHILGTAGLLLLLGSAPVLMQAQGPPGEASTPGITKEHTPPAEVDTLVWALASAKKAERSQAALLLGRYGNAAKAAAPALAIALQGDADNTAANSAAVALAQVGRPGVKYLIEALNDEDAAVRQRAAAAMTLLGPDARSAVPALLLALRDDSAQVRAAAAQALGEVGGDPKQVPPALCHALADLVPEVRRQAGLALASLGEDAVPALRTALKSVDPTIRIEAAQALAGMGSDARGAVADLARLLKDEEAQVRTAGAAALGALGEEAQEAIPILLEVLRTEKGYEVQVQTFQAITVIGSKDIPSLRKALKEINNTTTWATPYILKQFGPNAKDAIPFLIKGLSHKDPGNRLTAALALGEIGTDAKVAGPALMKALQDPSPSVRVGVAAALASVDPGQETLGKQHMELAFTQTYKVIATVRLQLQKHGLLRQPFGVLGANRPVDQRALKDPAIQALFNQIIDLRLFLAAYRPVSRMYLGDFQSAKLKLIDADLDLLINDLVPEAAPAIIRGINLAAKYNLGHC
jgi:HEAT repeat protein